MSDQLNALFEEYRALHSERVTSNSRQQTTLQIGTGIVAALISVALTLWSDNTLSGFLLFLVVPVTCYLVLFIWMGDLERVVHARVLLRRVEEEINARAGGGEPLLTWEGWFRETRDGALAHVLKWNYRAIFSLFMLYALSAFCLGAYGLYASSVASTVAIVALELLVFAGMILWYLSKARQFHALLLDRGGAS